MAPAQSASGHLGLLAVGVSLAPHAEMSTIAGRLGLSWSSAVAHCCHDLLFLEEEQSDPL
jgi:hypothetical protein